MVAAIDFHSHTTHDWIWFVSFLGVSRPFETYFSLCRPSSKEEERKEKR